jgi:hypothetical protein
MKSLIFLMLFGGLIISGLHFLQNLDREVSIQSVESKTSDGKKIYNKIRFSVQKGKDVWLMKQNHNELLGDWDELKIEVDTTKKPYIARYYQIKNEVDIEFRVACYKCHSNGPRAIRADYRSEAVQNSLIDKLQIFALNLKIKHYGEIQTPQNVKIKDIYRKVPLKHTGTLENIIVGTKTCLFCHGSKSYMKRSALRLQQKQTILHLVNTDEMPPWPIKMDAEEKSALLRQLSL